MRSTPSAPKIDDPKNKERKFARIRRLICSIKIVDRAILKIYPRTCCAIFWALWSSVCVGQSINIQVDMRTKDLKQNLQKIYVKVYSRSNVGRCFELDFLKDQTNGFAQKFHFIAAPNQRRNTTPKVVVTSKRYRKKLGAFGNQLTDSRLSYLVDFSHQDRSTNELIMLGKYLPKFVDNCRKTATTPSPQSTKIIVKKPHLWRINKSMSPMGGQLFQTTLNQAHIDLILLKGFTQLKTRFGKTPVRIITEHRKEIRRPLRFLKKAFLFMKKYWGTYPHEQLTILLTGKPIQWGVSGVIALNRPDQALFRYLQSEALNLDAWIGCHIMSSQWFGGHIKPKHPNDSWFFVGTNDLTCSRFFASEPKYKDLVQKDSFFHKLLSASYKQVNHMAATMHFMNAPFKAVASKKLKTHTPLEDQEPTQYTRQLYFLKHLEHYTNPTYVDLILKNFYRTNRGQLIEPVDFAAHLNDQSRLSRIGIKTILNLWWSTNSWPDWSIRSVLRKYDHHTKKLKGVLVNINAPKPFNVPVKVSFKAYSGRTKKLFTKKNPKTKRWYVYVPTQKPFKKIEIDSAKDIHDTDRFNNSSTFAPVKIFPGSAKNIGDDTYTALWFPFVSKSSSQPLFLGIEGAVMRYITSSISYSASYAPDSNIGTYNLTYNSSLNFLNYEFVINHDFRNIRQIKTGALVTLPYVNTTFGVGLKQIEKMGIKSSQSYVYSLSLRSPRFRLGKSQLVLSGVSEQSIGIIPQSSKYHRSHGKMTFTYRPSFHFGLRLQGFTGSVNFQGEIPESAKYFAASGSEANIHLDTLGAPTLEEIHSISSVVDLPLGLPFENTSLLLSKDIRIALGHDWGYAPRKNLVLQSAYGGFRIPLGGDLGGVGSVSLFTIAFDLVLFNRVGNEINTNTSFLFGITSNN